MNLKVSFKNVFPYFSNKFSQKYFTKCVHLNFKTLLFKYPPTMRKNEWTWKEVNWMKLNRAHVECKAKQGSTKINALWWTELYPDPLLLPATSICFKTNVIIQLEFLLDSVAEKQIHWVCFDKSGTRTWDRGLRIRLLENSASLLRKLYWIIPAE